MHQGLEWRREEPSWTELGKLKEQAGTSQVAVMNRAIKIKDEKGDKEGRGRLQHVENTLSAVFLACLG